MPKKNNSPRLSSGTSGGAASLLASLVCVLAGLTFGFVVLLVLGGITMSQNGDQFTFGNLLKITWEQGFKPIVQGGFYSKANMMGMAVRMEILQAAPLIMTGLSVAFAYKTGLFNIGAAGQYTVGAFMALYFAIVLKMPWWVCLIAAALGGAVWGAIPGFFKAFLNVNEVITAIMFNWIGLYMVNDIMYGKGKSPMYDLASTKTYSLRKAAPQAMIPSLGMSELFGKLQSVTIAIFIAIFFAIVVYIILNKTAFGYELRACGFNKNAARYAGINEKRNIILAMMISGALAGVGAGLYYLSTVAEWNPQVSTALPAMGFNGISTALLACSNPIGTIFSSLFISYITVGGTKLSTQYYTKEIADVITALIIYLCAFSLLFKNKIRALLAGKAKRVSVGKGGDD